MRVLVIGYGNPSRRDDGVALHVVNALRERWGRPRLRPGGDGWEELGGEKDSLFLQQLAPELAATLAQYDLAIFVDAALPGAEERIRTEAVVPGYRLAATSHHLEPATLLALARQLYGRGPQAFLLSIRGHSLDFGEQLSAETAAAVPEAADRAAALIDRCRDAEAPEM